MPILKALSTGSFGQKSLFLIVLTLSFFACAKKEALMPLSFKPYEGVVTVEALRKSLIFDDIKSIRSEVTIGILKGGKTIEAFEGIIAYMKPDSLNMRFFGPLGLTAAEVILLNNYVQVYIPFKNTLYEGEIPHLLGQLPSGEAIYSIDETDEGYALNEFRPSVGSQSDKETMEIKRRYTFSRAVLLNTGIAVYDKGERFADVSFGDFSDSKLPMTVNVFLSNGFAMDIRLIEPVVDAEISVDFFKPKSHKDIEVKPLKELFEKGKGAP